MRVLDLACGHGTLANELAARGCRVTGLDSSAVFLNRARADAGVDVDYVAGDMRSLPWTAHFDRVVNWSTAFGYFDDDTNRGVRGEVARALRPGGRLAMDLDNPTAFLAGYTPSRITAARDNDDMLVDRYHLDPLTARLDAHRTVVRDGRARTLTFVKRLFGFPELRDWLLAAGLAAAAGHGEDGQRLSLGHHRMVVVAQRGRPPGAAHNRVDETARSLKDGPMRFGMSVPPFGPYGDPHRLADLAAAAEGAGWDGFFVWDHMIFDPSFHPVVDPWVGLAAVALRTRRVTIGTMVTPLARRRPWKVARETVSLDRLCGGRFVLGVGLGDPAQWDYGFFGEQTDARLRAAKLDEALTVLAGLWTGEPFAFDGEHYTLSEVTFRPTPLRQPRIPVWVGGWWPNKRPLRRAARWDGMAPISRGGEMRPDEVAEAVEYVRRHRDSDAPFEVVVSGRTGPAPQDAERLAAHATAGATWWLEDISPWRFGADPEAQWLQRDTEAMERRVSAGPPRLS